MTTRTTTDDAIDAEAARSIVVTRTIDGPRPRVFEAWTDIRHLSRWWGPHGFSTTTTAFDFRPGGVWEFVMHGPDGTDYPNRVEWREIVPPERIAYLHGARADDPDAFLASVTFAERGRGTEITLRTVFRTAARRDEVVERYGALEGARQTLERFARHFGERS